MKRLALAVALLTSITQVFAATTFQAEISGTDLWLRNKNNGITMFEYRLGAGGAIGKFYSVAESRDFLAPSFSGEVTDRVIQLATWDLDNHAPPTDTGYNSLWNVDQAGTEENLLHATVDVKVSNTNHRVDVYSVGDLQWKAALRGSTGYAFNGKVSMLTRYDMTDDGVLKIRRVVYHAPLKRRDTTGGAFNTIDWQQLLHQNWIPFKSGAAATNDFDAVAMGLDTNGVPNWWYQWNNNIPTTGWPVQNTWGYSVMFDSTSPSTKSFVSVIYGQNTVTSPYAASWNVLLTDYNFTTYGVQLLAPEMYVLDPAAGFIVDSNIALYPGTALNKAASDKIKSLVAGVPAPVVYAPGSPFSGELATIVSTIQADATTTLTSGMRVDHIAPLITP